MFISVLSYERCFYEFLVIYNTTCYYTHSFDDWRYFTHIIGFDVITTCEQKCINREKH
jgi:hypothetical protein